MKNTKCLFDETKQTPGGMVSVSQLQTFMSCPKKWEYGYVENLTPRVDRPFLTVGKLCHKGMQVAMTEMWKLQTGVSKYDHTNWFKAIIRVAERFMQNEWEEYITNNTFLAEEMPEQEQILADAIAVFKQAFEEFKPWKYDVLTVCKDGVEIPALELHFVVPCAGSKGLHGYIDAILKDKETGSIWCTDYKFRKSLSPDDEEAVNIQNAVYTHACKKMGIKITGTMTWQHCNTPAADPALNKNGTVSRSKIKTTWNHYAEFCRVNGVDPAPYEEEMREKLSGVEWFRATYEYRNDDTIKNMWNQIVVPAAYAIKSARTVAKKDKNRRHLYPWNCKMCQFKDLCQAELRDHDVDFLRNTQYVKRSHTMVTPEPQSEE